MKPDHGAATGLSPARGHARPVMPVLIRVPALHAIPSLTRRPAGPAPARGRRRLRREVRLVGSALLIGMTTTLGLLPMWAGRGPGRALAASAAPAPASSPAAAASPVEREPVASLSPAIEPTTPREFAHPVVLFGVIVPDDGAEEASHHGGD